MALGAILAMACYAHFINSQVTGQICDFTFGLFPVSLMDKINWQLRYYLYDSKISTKLTITRNESGTAFRIAMTVHRWRWCT